MLTTEPAVSSDSARLEERIKVLEEKLESLVKVLKESWICEPFAVSGHKKDLYNMLTII